MKKILIPVLLGLLCAPVRADENLQELVRALGYTDSYIVENLLPKSAFVINENAAPQKPAQASCIEPQRDPMDPEDLLHPRVYSKSESTSMIPILLRYHRSKPTSPKITRKLAVTCLKNGQPREALYWYTQTYHRDRSDFESLWNMAAISYRLGEMQSTLKYLREYAVVDPYSAWGRMAKEFISGRFSGANLSDGFAGEIGKAGVLAGGVSDASGAENGILVIQGKRTTPDSFMTDPVDEPEIVRPKKLKDTLKGKTRAEEKILNPANITERKTLAEAAQVVTPEEPATVSASSSEKLAVKATAPPLAASTPSALPDTVASPAISTDKN